MGTSHLVVDGSNIATEGRSSPSLAQLNESVTQFLGEEHFDNVVVVVDASFPNRIADSEKEEYEEAIVAGEILTPPAGTIGRGDAFVLTIAERSGATVLSNDSFQEFHGDHPWLFEEGRLIGGKPVPGIGWVFTGRMPVRGPKSKRSVRAANSSEGRGKTGTAKKTTKTSTARKKSSTSGGARKSPAKSPARSGDAKGTSSGKGRQGQKTQDRKVTSQHKGPEPTNSPEIFLSFITNHQPGATIDGEVVEFASHGAYVMADRTRCYVPLKLLGSPPPRSAKDVLAMGEVRQFVVQEYDQPRRGVVLLPTGVGPSDTHTRQSVPSDQSVGSSGVGSDNHPAEEAPVATKKKAPAKKAPAKKKATAKKATTKKAPAKKAPAKKKATAKKATTKKKSWASREAAKVEADVKRGEAKVKRAFSRKKK